MIAFLSQVGNVLIVVVPITAKTRYNHSMDIIIYWIYGMLAFSGILIAMGIYESFKD
jgi:hypothetical protein